MLRPYLAALLAATALNIAPAHAANHDHAQPANVSSTVRTTPKLILEAPRADLLETGNVYLPFHVENMSILPLYTEIHGEQATTLTPTIGHLHVKVDDNAWSWIHAQPEPIYFGALSPGKHRMVIELVDASHAVIETQTLELTVPAR